METKKSNKKSNKKSIPFIKRQYMNSTNYEVFYYSDIKLDTVQKHCHCHYEFYFFLEGDVKYVVEDECYILKKGDVLIIPPDIAHGPIFLSDTKPYHRFVLWLSREFVEKIKTTYKNFDYCIQYARNSKNYLQNLNYIEFNNVFLSLLDLWQEYNNEYIFKDDIIINCISALILKINRFVYENNNPGNTPKSDLYTLILDYIDKNITENLTLEKIAKDFFVNKYYVAHIFKKQPRHIFAPIYHKEKTSNMQK